MKGQNTPMPTDDALYSNSPSSPSSPSFHLTNIHDNDVNGDGDDELSVIVAETNITSDEHDNSVVDITMNDDEVDGGGELEPFFFSDTLQISFKSFVQILQYLSPCDIVQSVIPVCTRWRDVVLDETNDVKIWRPIATVQERTQQLSDYNFCGNLFECADFEMLRNDEHCVNPVFVHCGALWRKLCLFKELYNRFCEICFLHCFTGEEHLFAEMDCEATRKAVFFGPRHVPVGKSTLVKAIALGRQVDEHERRKISPTTGLESTMLNALVDQTSFVRIQNLDTVMNTFQHSLRTAQGCAVQVYVFDLSNPLSLETLMQGFMYEFIKHPHGNARRLLVGLKQDLKVGKDLSNKAMQFAVENRLFYLECSSLTGYNIALLSRLTALLSFPI